MILLSPLRHPELAPPPTAINLVIPLDLYYHFLAFAPTQESYQALLYLALAAGHTPDWSRLSQIVGAQLPKTQPAVSLENF